MSRPRHEGMGESGPGLCPQGHARRVPQLPEARDHEPRQPLPGVRPAPGGQEIPVSSPRYIIPTKICPLCQNHQPPPPAPPAAGGGGWWPGSDPVNTFFVVLACVWLVALGYTLAKE